MIFFAGKTADKSFSQDSSDGAANVETHRRSKSILKNKSESSVCDVCPNQKKKRKKISVI